jgi:hypothetical protein
MPEIIKKFNSKFFALVMGATHNDVEGNQTEVLLLMTSDIGELDISQAELDKTEEFIEVEDWETKDPDNFQNIVVPFRRAIVWQG